MHLRHTLQVILKLILVTLGKPCTAECKQNLTFFVTSGKKLKLFHDVASLLSCTYECSRLILEVIADIILDVFSHETAELGLHTLPEKSLPRSY